MNESGRGATVLAIHSLGLDAHAFDAWRKAFGSGWHIATFDQCGHGKRVHEASSSLERYVADAAEVLAACDAGPVHVVGHSMGGAVAALLASRTAAEQSGRIATLTLIASPARGVPAFLERGAAVRASGVESVIGATMARWFGEEGAVRDAKPQNYARSALGAMQAEGLAGAWEALAQFPGYQDIAGSLPPTLCIASANDISTPPQAMQAIVDAFDQAGRGDEVALKTLAEGGHMAPLYATPDLLDALTGHWRAHGADSSLKH